MRQLLVAIDGFARSRAPSMERANQMQEHDGH
jgi:hypothetical protein